MIFTYEKLKKDRNKIGMLQEELSEISGISLSVLKNIESGRKKIEIDSEELKIICNILNTLPESYFVRDTKVISFFSNKGGCGKTSLTANLAYVFAKEHHKKILLIDADQQQNLTKHFGLLNSGYCDEKNIYISFMKQESLKNHIVKTKFENIDLVASSFDVGNIDVVLPSMSYREQRFNNILKHIKEEGYYDFIFIDCNPSFSMWNHIITCTVDKVLVPLEASPFGLCGIENVINLINAIKEETKQSSDHIVETLGIVVSKYDKRVKMSSAIANIASQIFENEEHIFNTKIPFNASIAKGQAEEQPIGVNYSKSDAYKAFKELSKEILKRV